MVKLLHSSEMSFHLYSTVPWVAGLFELPIFPYIKILLIYVLIWPETDVIIYCYFWIYPSIITNKIIEVLKTCRQMPFCYYNSKTCHLNEFDVGVTFEMREPNTEKSIFRLILIKVSQHLLNERVKGKVAERQRERSVRVRV